MGHLARLAYGGILTAATSSIQTMTVGTGIAPVQLLDCSWGSRTVPPIGNFTLP
ncbi:hypothetical protein BHAP_0300 [Bifidobacterium hapali]|uniref:Uncharacterized protein n=1 Tax=Bifidobacterium hapali TaxID=1630172 RepID=A0A261G4V7_9BIFI|nr:hypothetical protein BHAP_0300 [Bifidobacterium hapali]